MIYKDGKEIVAITGLGHEISEVRKGIDIVWQAIRSCYGSGAWINDRPWLEDDPWKD